MQNKAKLKVAIDCRITNPQQGIGTAVMGLASALSRYSDAEQEYVFLVAEEPGPWLQPYVSGSCSMVTIPMPFSARIKGYLRRSLLLRKLWQRFRPDTVVVPESDGYVEAQGFDVVHFPTQIAYRTALPSIYQPQDLQHLHHPEFFTPLEYATREALYRAYCEQATAVCLQTEWSKKDIVTLYGISEDKVVVIPWASVFEAYTAPTEKDRDMTRTRYGLPEQFFFYPAATWPHKNHEVVLRAVAELNAKHGRRVHVYFTGGSTEFRATLDRLMQELAITDLVHFLGFVSHRELQCLFSLATAMIFASRFEGFGLPVLEAFQARTPLLSSSATVLPETAQEGALYFDPDSPQELAERMAQLLDEPELRAELVSKGLEVLARYSAERTATLFQQLYGTVFLANR